MTRRRHAALKATTALLVAGATLALGGCGLFHEQTSRTVLLGESSASGAEAVQEANIALANAERAGCKAIAVGGYAAAASPEAGGGLVIGVPVMVKCPVGVVLRPDGRLLLANSTASHLLSLPRGAQGQPLIETVRFPALLDAVHEASRGTAARVELLLQGPPRRELLGRAAPLPGSVSV